MKVAVRSRGMREVILGLPAWLVLDVVWYGNRMYLNSSQLVATESNWR
jgi:hypothetical protein